jgi:hypothetical protein
MLLKSEKSRLFHSFTEGIKRDFVDDPLYKLMPLNEIHGFFSEIEVQLRNKRKLHDDICKLKNKDPAEEGS